MPSSLVAYSLASLQWTKAGHALRSQSSERQRTPKGLSPALAGLNPEAVKDVVTALEDYLSMLRMDPHSNAKGGVNEPSPCRSGQAEGGSVKHQEYTESTASFIVRQSQKVADLKRQKSELIEALRWYAENVPSILTDQDAGAKARAAIRRATETK
jgi:hypothetical protein